MRGYTDYQGSKNSSDIFPFFQKCDPSLYAHSHTQILRLYLSRFWHQLYCMGENLKQNCFQYNFFKRDSAPKNEPPWGYHFSSGAQVKIVNSYTALTHIN